jgi:ubiquitin-protein ligase E3 D
VSHDLESEAEKHDSALFITAQLLHLIESNIGRKVVIHCNKPDGLLCWIFNPDIYYTSSKRGPTVHRAIKAFYKKIDEPLKLLDDHQSTLEELALPEQEYKQLAEALQESAQILPLSARTFQDWQVGLLDRYEKNPSGQGAMDHNALNHQAPEKIELFKLPEGWSELYV